MRKQNQKPRPNPGRRKFKIDATTATVLGLVLTVIALIPSFWGLFSTKTVPEVVNLESSIPLQIEFLYEYLPPEGYHILPPGILPDQLDVYKLEPVSLPALNLVYFSITNISNRKILVNNKLPVKVIDYQPQVENVDILFLVRGAGSLDARDFVVDIPADTSVDLVSAVFEEKVGSNPSDVVRDDGVDFFIFDPGEVEVFRLEVRFLGAGSFTFQPGVDYFQEGKIVHLWTPEPITAFVPQNMTLWSLPPATGPNEYVYLERCSFRYVKDANSLFQNMYMCNQ